MGHRLHRPQSSQARTQADSVRGVAVGRWRGLNKAGGVTNQVTPHPIHHRAWPMSIRHDNLDRLLGIFLGIAPKSLGMSSPIFRTSSARDQLTNTIAKNEPD